MKVCVVGNHDSYKQMGTWCSDAFKMNGHEVVRIDRNNIVIPQDTQIAMYVDCSEDFSGNMSETKAIKVFWSLDAHMPGGIERSVNIARKCDLVFSSNYEYGVKLLEKFGIESILMPITSNNFIASEMEEVQVAMIGHANSPERLKLWELLKNYKSFCGEVSDETWYNNIMVSSDIVVNQPTEPWDVILNNRFFEAMMSNSLLLQKRLKTSLIERLGFNEYQHFIYWDNFEDLKQKLDYDLDKEHSKAHKEKGRIVADAQRKVQQYSMSNQVSKIESIILSKFYDRL